MEPVFVYGTLKQGFPNHDRAGMGRFRCLGRFRTREAYPLVIGGRWFSPVLIDEPGQGHRIVGEVYEVDEAGMAILDTLESTHLANGYRRVHRTVEAVDGGAAIEAWIYVKDRAAIEGIHTGLLAEYTLGGGYPRYVPHAERR